MKPRIRKHNGCWQVANMHGNITNPIFLSALKWCLARTAADSLAGVAGVAYTGSLHTRN